MYYYVFLEIDWKPPRILKCSMIGDDVEHDTNKFSENRIITNKVKIMQSRTSNISITPERILIAQILRAMHKWNKCRLKKS